jgi:hypothetical protein
MQLLDRYPYNYFVALFNRTQSLRRPPEEIEKEENNLALQNWLESADYKDIDFKTTETQTVTFNPKEFLPWQ